MNLFRSEEHVKAWHGYSPEAAGGLLPLADINAIFGAAYFRERGNGHYISSMRDLRGDFMDTLARVTDNDPFWMPKPA